MIKMKQYYINRSGGLCQNHMHMHQGAPYWHPVVRKHAHEFHQTVEGLKEIIDRLVHEYETLKKSIEASKKVDDFSLKSSYLGTHTYTQASSETECRNVVCVCCCECLEHACSDNHNNYHACLCDDCRDAINKCTDDNEKIELLQTELKKRAVADGRVCEEYIRDD